MKSRLLVLFSVLITGVFLIVQISVAWSAGQATFQTPPTPNSLSATTPAPAAPTLNPQPTATPDNVVDWERVPVIGPIIQNLQAIGGDDLVTAFVGFLVAALAFNFSTIRGWLGRFFKWLWENAKGRGKEYTFEKLYLDWMIEQHRHLGLLPAQVIARRWGDRQQFSNLEDIYVRLSISTQNGDEQWAAAYGQGEHTWRPRPGWLEAVTIYIKRWLTTRLDVTEFDKWFSRWLSEEPDYQPGDLGFVIDRHKRLIMRGDPGSGKTTLLRYLAVTCARAMRENTKDGDSRNLVKRRLSWKSKPFPFFLRLSKLGNVINWDQEYGICEAIRDELPSELRRKCPSGYFERRLKKGNCLVLLDALDELGSPTARGAMAGQIQGFLEVYDMPSNRVVVTTRIIGYEGQLNQYGFHIRTVQELEVGEIRALIKQRYKAITIIEAVGRNSEEDERAIEHRLQQRSRALIDKIESISRLHQLARNPMLLSLIVLVHFLKVDLPEERVLLYRDCVEILTERWQQTKREELGLRGVESELTLTQKLALLYEIAFAMQMRRDSDGGPVLIAKDLARDIVAAKLRDFVSFGLPESEEARRGEFQRRAEAWIAGVQTESGILVERGLDQRGEPLIGFSHLTFQEYLAAVAISEVKDYRQHLASNLLDPSWREVVLLYVVLARNATPILEALLSALQQPTGILLAGHCLAEKATKVEPQTQQKVMEALQRLFDEIEIDQLDDLERVYAANMNSEITRYIYSQIHCPIMERQVSAVRVLGKMRLDDPQIDLVRRDLFELFETGAPPEVMVTIQETLAQIGDPRFVALEPVLSTIPMVPLNSIQTFIPRKKYGMPRKGDVENFGLLQFSIGWAWLVWNVHHWIYVRLRHWSSDKTYTNEFEISRYPVTNFEYSRFVNETGVIPPFRWTEGRYPLLQATHPVTGVSRKQISGYCGWLSKKSGRNYRLPNEWEWEIAAGKIQGKTYPWGNGFDKMRCNTVESGNEGTTPVGSYQEGQSIYGVFDLCGNVHETVTPGRSTSTVLIIFMGFLILFVGIIFQSFSPTFLLFSGFYVLLCIGAVISLARSLSSKQMDGAIDVTFDDIVKGGSWASSYYRATCYHSRTIYDIGFTRVGFRVVREKA